MKTDRDYVLGTHDEEVSRLGLQHRVWRPRALDAWRRAGFNVGQTLVDVGCGPGYATVDLAEIVGPTGRVVALERSRRFLNVAEAKRERLGLEQVTTHELDLDEAELPVSGADGAWCRWVLAFVRDPRSLLARVGASLRPNGVLVVHEYFDYGTWRLSPRLPEIEEFVDIVMRSWRDAGGEPDVGLELPVWLDELGFDTMALQPIIDIVPRTNMVWSWPRAFIDVNLRRLTDLGYLDQARAAAISSAFAEQEAKPHTRMITPAVVEIIARRR